MGLGTDREEGYWVRLKLSDLHNQRKNVQEGKMKWKIISIIIITFLKHTDTG